MLTKVVRVYPAVKELARTPLGNGKERVQHTAWIQLKTVIIDLALINEVNGVIEEEFPGIDGEFCLDGLPAYADVIHHTDETQNITLNGSRRIDQYRDGEFHCTQNASSHPGGIR